VSTTTDTEVAAYLDRLRRELAGLPADEIEEILQDLEPQLAAIAAGLDDEPVSLADRLGDPAEYARELRSAMGVPDEPQPKTPMWVSRAALWLLVATTGTAVVGAYLTARVIANDPRPVLWSLAFGLLGCWFVIGRQRSTVAEIAELPEVRDVRDRLAAAERHLPVAAYVASLRPGLRLVKAALVWLGVVWLFRWFGWYGAGAATAAFAFAALTVWVGHRARTDRRWLWLSVPLTGWAVGVAVKSMELLPLLATGDHVWP
jgi:membrane-associated phospholipid phosphatase